jgi:hypothetical protein
MPYVFKHQATVNAVQHQLLCCELTGTNPGVESELYLNVQMEDDVCTHSMLKCGSRWEVAGLVRVTTVYART